MSRWAHPKEVKQGFFRLNEYLPALSEIPEEFKVRGHNKWVKVMEDWFFQGIVNPHIIMHEGVDKVLAFRHLNCVIRSFEPQHEHKTAGVAYLMSLWLKDMTYELKKEKR